MLRYATINSYLGKYIILIIAMGSDLLGFMFMFFFCLLGFFVVFIGLFQGSTTTYNSALDTLAALFSSALSNYDASFTQTFEGSPYKYIGVFLLLVYVIFFAVVMLNLVIAQMSSTFETLSERADLEWGFRFKRLVKDYLLLTESNPLCMLSPPLNLIPMMFFLPHYLSLYGAKAHTLVC